jgi:membrane dipeptidase
MFADREATHSRVGHPVIDLHCDLLSYMQEVPAADPFDRDAIGCNFPALKAGNVKLQVMAIYSFTGKGSTHPAVEQSVIYRSLYEKYPDTVRFASDVTPIDAVESSSNPVVMAAIENASGFCEEDEPLESGFERLERIMLNTRGLLYIGLTHHGENRFGGGNATHVGLKDDGRSLLDYISGRKIAIDLSHASDALAMGILDHVSKYSLDVPVLASHSNFRAVFNHPRNLPDEIAKEIIHRKGVIGINFLRAFLNNDDPEAIYEHILYGISMGPRSICFGADYFNTASHPDQSRKPFFFSEQSDAGCYPSILSRLGGTLSPEMIAGLSFNNAMDFIRRTRG